MEVMMDPEDYEYPNPNATDERDVVDHTDFVDPDEFEELDCCVPDTDLFDFDGDDLA